MWPREHGAWGILSVALVTGAAAGFSSLATLPQLLWLAFAATAAFSLRTPLENSLPASPFRARNRAEWRWLTSAMVVYTFACAFAVGMLWHEGVLRLIWKPAIVAGALFALQAMVKRAGHAGRLPSEIIGAFGLALVALASWTVAAGRFDFEAITLWLINGLFATNQILYVQLRIREVRDPKEASYFGSKLLFLVGEVVTVLILFAAWRARLLPWFALLAFLPILVRGGAWSFRRRTQPLQIHRLGKSELAHAILFGLLVILSFRLRVL